MIPWYQALLSKKKFVHLFICLSVYCDSLHLGSITPLLNMLMTNEQVTGKSGLAPDKNKEFQGHRKSSERLDETLTIQICL